MGSTFSASLIRPLELAGLFAAIRAVVRRGEAARSAQIDFGDGDGLLDARKRQVWWRGTQVGFTARGCALRETLALSRGRCFIREELMTRVRGPDFGSAARVVAVYVSYVRRKLAAEVRLSSRGLGDRVP